MDLEEHTDEPTALVPLEGPPPGTVLLDKYRVDFMLGIGGYGYVVKAHHLELGEAVAIKILRDDRETDPQTLRRFKREAQLVVKLKSEHVARVLDVGNLPTGAPYMIMELLDGEDLGKVLENGPLQLTRAVDYILQTCEALAEAHGLGIVHRDIKPGNLFLAKLPGRAPIIKVLDFGISKNARRKEDSMRLTQTQSILGTPAYMSPEQMRDPRNVDFRSDIWALGTVLYELVEGELPFDAENFAELVINVSTHEPRRMMLAPELSPVIERCLGKRMDERFQNVAELAIALAPFGTPDTAREYVGRICQLLGIERPSEESLARILRPQTAPRAFERPVTPMPAPTQLVEPLPALDHFVTTTHDRKRRTFPWLVMLLVAIVTSIATVAVFLFVVRKDPEPEDRPIATTPDAPAARPDHDAATATRKDKPEDKPDDKPDKPDDKPAPPASGSGSASNSSSAAKVSTKPAGSGRVIRVGAGSAKVGPGSAKTVTVPAKDPKKYCPDGSLIANHMHGCPKPR